MQAITCVGRSLVSLRDSLIYIYFESLDDAETFLETWIFLVDQSEMECETEATNASIRLPLVRNLSQTTLRGLKQYLAMFGRGGYLLVDEEDGVSFVFNDPVDAELMRQQFGHAFRNSECQSAQS